MADKTKALRIYLLTVGLLIVLCLSFGPPFFFGDWLLWHPRNLAVELMIGSLYFAMGTVMIAAARNPTAHQGLVDFVILGNIIHASVMLIYSENWRHVVLDSGTIGLIGILPLFFYPWGVRRFLQYGVSMTRK